MTLQFNILTIFLVLLIITLTSIVSFAYYKNSNSVLDLTERFIRRVAESCIKSSIAMFDPVADIIKSSAQLVADDELKGRDGSLFPYMVSALENNPQLQSLYFAFDSDGRFLQAFPVPPDIQKFGANDAKPPAGAQYAYRVIDRKNGVYSDIWTYVKRDGTVVGTETSNQLNYDPRPRPWYKDAVKNHGMILSDLLVYTSNRQPGITAAVPIVAKDGRVIGVSAANITTNQISDFLKQLDLGPSGIALLVDESEQVIAYPDASKTLHQDGLKLSLVKADELEEEKVRDAFKAYRANPKDLIRFMSNGENYLGSFTQFPEEFGKKWILAGDRFRKRFRRFLEIQHARYRRGRFVLDGFRGDLRQCAGPLDYQAPAFAVGRDSQNPEIRSGRSNRPALLHFGGQRADPFDEHDETRAENLWDVRPSRLGAGTGRQRSAH